MGAPCSHGDPATWSLYTTQCGSYNIKQFGISCDYDSLPIGTLASVGTNKGNRIPCGVTSIENGLQDFLPVHCAVKVKRYGKIQKTFLTIYRTGYFATSNGVIYQYGGGVKF